MKHLDLWCRACSISCEHDFNDAMEGGAQVSTTGLDRIELKNIIQSN